jgi:hypothetical protein
MLATISLRFFFPPSKIKLYLDLLLMQAEKIGEEEKK